MYAMYIPTQLGRYFLELCWGTSHIEEQVRFKDGPPATISGPVSKDSQCASAQFAVPTLLMKIGEWMIAHVP